MTLPAPPPSPPAAPPEGFDVIVAGAGVVGLATAVALARAGLRTACVGPAGGEPNGRTVALLDGSVRFLDGLGLWAGAAPLAAPLRTLRIVDDTGSLFRGPPTDFAAAEVGLPAFGQNIENVVLLGVLERAAGGVAGLTRVEGLVAGHAVAEGSVRVTTDGGRILSGRLLVAADGARSPLREAAGIPVRLHRYPQVALTAVLAHAAPHGDVSTEFHTRGGPFTLVPMVPGPDGGHRSSLVWVMPPDEAERRAALPREAFARAVERQARFLLGRVTVPGSVGRFPILRAVAERLVAPRLALAGEAAHALPPIGAQGLNLSLRDAAVLAEVLGGAGDPGEPGILHRYERARTGDVALRTAAVDALNRSLLGDHRLPVDLLRGAGLAALRAVRPLRVAVMRQGLGAEGPRARDA